MKVDVQLHGLAGVLETLKSLPPELVSKRGGPVKAALRKGALVILREAQMRLQRATANAAADDESGELQRTSSGLLEQNLIVSRGKAPTTGKGERYLVRVRRKPYGNRKDNRGPVTTRKSAQLLEYGSNQQPAEPWLRPAFSAKAREAIHTTERELIKGLDRVVKKLAAQNKGKR